MRRYPSLAKQERHRRRVELDQPRRIDAPAGSVIVVTFRHPVDPEDLSPVLETLHEQTGLTVIVLDPDTSLDVLTPDQLAQAGLTRMETP